MEKDRRGKSGRSGDPGDEKLSQNKAVIVRFDSRIPIEEFNSFIQHHIEGGKEAFFIIARSANDLDGARKLAESLKGENGVVSIKDNRDDRLTPNKGIVTLYRPTPNVKRKGK